MPTERPQLLGEVVVRYYKLVIKHIGFEILMAVAMKSAVFWVETP
jgi:hypothetical protein